MIIRTTYLARINNKGKLQLAMVQLDRNESTYSVYRTTWQVHGKEREYNPLFINKGRNSNYIVREAFHLYEVCIRQYVHLGYVRLEDLTEKTIEELKEDELNDLLNNYEEPTIKLPRLVRPTNWEEVATSTMDREWYWTYRIPGIRCLVFIKDGELVVKTDYHVYLHKTIQHLLSEDLVAMFQKEPDLALDCMIYSHEPKSSREHLVKLVKASEWTEECKDLHLYVCDYISDNSLEERIEHLQDLFKEITNPMIHLVEWGTLEGYYLISSKTRKAIKEGYPGLWLKANREYGGGRKSAFLYVETEHYRTRTYVIKQYTGDNIVKIDNSYNNYFYATIAGPCNFNVEYYKKHPNELVGKQVLLAFQELHNGIPTNPIVWHLNDKRET